MWMCSKCGRVFERKDQVHSCRVVPLEKHFENKELARELFEYLVGQIEKEIGKYKIISIPCCIHLFGSYDFLAALPKKKGLEIRFGLNRKLESIRMTQAVQVSSKVFKICIDVTNIKEIDSELLGWIGEAYHLKKKI